MSKYKLTYRFDQEPPTHKQATLEDEASNIEQLIREAEPNIQTMDEHELVELPPNTPLLSQLRQRRFPDAFWWKSIISIVAAIATGILFGTVALSLLAQPTINSPRPNQIEENLNVELQPAVLNEVAETSIQLTERRLFLLQNGVFETLEAATTFAAALKNKGLAATIDKGERFIVYTGMTSNREAALRVGRRLQQNQVEIYIKPYSLPIIEQVPWMNAEAEATFINYVSEGSNLIQKIGDLTLVHLDGDEPIALEPSTLPALKDSHMAYTEWATVAEASVTSEARTPIQQMNIALRTAIDAIEEYDANPDVAFLWSAQSALMEYVFANQRLYAIIGAQGASPVE
jgi:stage II sporulation protein B